MKSLGVGEDGRSSLILIAILCGTIPRSAGAAASAGCGAGARGTVGAAPAAAAAATAAGCRL